MPKFIVRQERAAVIIYEAKVEAEGADEALALAEADECQWDRTGGSEFDDRALEVYAESDEHMLEVLAVAEG